MTLKDESDYFNKISETMKKLSEVDKLFDVEEDFEKDLNIFQKILHPKKSDYSWTTTTSTAELDPRVIEELQGVLKKPDTYLGELHFDIESGDIYVMVGETRIPVTDLNDFKKMATKKMLKDLDGD